MAFVEIIPELLSAPAQNISLTIGARGISFTKAATREYSLNEYDHVKVFRDGPVVALYPCNAPQGFRLSINKNGGAVICNQSLKTALCGNDCASQMYDIDKREIKLSEDRKLQCIVFRLGSGTPLVNLRKPKDSVIHNQPVKEMPKTPDTQSVLGNCPVCGSEMATRMMHSVKKLYCPKCFSKNITEGRKAAAARKNELRASKTKEPVKTTTEKPESVKAEPIITPKYLPLPADLSPWNDRSFIKALRIMAEAPQSRKVGKFYVIQQGSGYVGKLPGNEKAYDVVTATCYWEPLDGSLVGYSCADENEYYLGSLLKG